MGSRDAEYKFFLKGATDQLDNSFWLYSIGEIMRYIAPKYISNNLSILTIDDKEILSVTLGKINKFIYEFQ